MVGQGVRHRGRWGCTQGRGHRQERMGVLFLASRLPWENPERTGVTPLVWGLPWEILEDGNDRDMDGALSGEGWTLVLGHFGLGLGGLTPGP